MTTAPPAFRDRLVFDAATGEIRDETRRYMLIRPEALMGVFRRLPPPMRAPALEAFAESVFEQGSDSARAYAAMGGGGEALARTVAATAPQLGWGIWTVEIAPGRLVVSVENSPFATGFGPAQGPVCHPIRGMVRAVGSLIFGRAAQARETACAACGAALCRFEATPAEDDPAAGGR